MQAQGREPKPPGQTACLPCRRRKSRCKYEPGSQACLMCRAHEVECVPVPRSRPHPLPPRTPRARIRATPRARSSFAAGAEGTSSPDTQVMEQSAPRAEPHSTTPAHVGNPIHPPFSGTLNSTSLGPALASTTHPVPLDEAEDDSPHIMGPAVASDNHFLEDYLSTTQAGNGARTIRPVLPGMTSSPVVFTRVQKRPLGIATHMSLSRTKLQTIDKLLEPCQEQVINMYFTKANGCLPILDESFFVDSSIAKGRVSPAVMACLYANALIYWRHDTELLGKHHPDGRFIWNLALEAVYSELYMSPGMPSVVAILLNVGGRPTTTMIGNGVLLGSAVSLAHGLGLNRNPVSWDIPEQEKSFRIRIWWCLVIYDRWASLMYGTPPHIRQDYYDVPAPKALSSARGDGRAEVFEALASLTEILGSYLEQLYRVAGQPRDRTTCILNLDSWTDTLPGSVRKVIIRGTNLDISGAANLRLCFLAAKFFSRRLDIGADVEGTVSGQPPDERFLEIRRIVEEIVLFVSELTEKQLGDFWLPTSAFVFTSTVTFLVRLAVQAEIPTSGPSESLSLSLAVDLIASLRSYKEDHGWELGDICVAQYGEMVDKLSTQQDTAQVDGAWLDLEPPFISDPAFLDSIIADQWDPLVWNEVV